MKNIILLNLI